MPARAADAALQSKILGLPTPDWLAHDLTVAGPAAALAAFRQAAAGAGVVPWTFDYDRMEEDWFHLIIATPAHRRSVSVTGARILARRLREAVWDQHEHAVSEVGVSRACPFDLHALLPVPSHLLGLGPDHPASLGWLWENWGTTWPLRHVRGKAGEDFRCSFWAADWSPWRALATLRQRFPTLRLELVARYQI